MEVEFTNGILDRTINLKSCQSVAESFEVDFEPDDIKASDTITVLYSIANN